MPSRQTGIRVRVGKDGSRSYEAAVYSARDGKKIRQTFATEAAARQWRADAMSAISRGGVRAPAPTTLREAAAAWLTGAQDGSILNRSNDRYKPSVIRGYERALRRTILPAFGAYKLAEVTAADVQALADRLHGSGMDASTLRNTLMPLRAIYRRACRPGGPALVNPTTGLQLPAVRGRRDRIASPEEAARLIELLPRQFDRTLWATAFYAGLRLGELLALRWDDVDLARGEIHVTKAYDPVAREFVEPKSRAGKREVPVAVVLRDHLLAWKLEQGGEGLVFGRTPDVPFDLSSTGNRAKRAWARAKVQPIGLHEARHSYASLMIAANVNAKALATFMGHSSITITLDRYGHLMPGNKAEAAALLDAYLERANTQARLAQIDSHAPVMRQ